MPVIKSIDRKKPANWKTGQRAKPFVNKNSKDHIIGF
jgi:hypothetical protein